MKIAYLIGFMASGKTTRGKMWAAEIGANFYDLDAWIEQKEKTSIQHIFTQKGEQIFREIERNALHSLTEMLLVSPQQSIVACGGGTPCFFDNMKYMQENGKVIFLNPPFEIILERLQQDTTRPMLALHSDLKDLYEKRLPIYQKADEIWTD